ncbi:MAG: hypothetical protein ACKO0Z_23085 [Betaproteobacteria bacterium]
MSRNLEDYMADQVAFDALSEDDKARLFAGESLDGEIARQEEPPVAAKSNESPAVAIEEKPGDQEPQQENKDPVVLARDGKHTIPFSELETARERARQLEAELAQIKAASEQKPAEKPVATQEQNPQPAVDPKAGLLSLIRERDEALFSGDTDKAAELSMKIMDTQEEIASAKAYARLKSEMEASQAEQAQKTALQMAQDRAETLVKQYDFLNPSSAAVNQDAIDLVVAQRDRLIAQGVSLHDAIEQAVTKVAPLFSKVAQSDMQTDVAKRAAEVVQKAKSQVPTSLSQVPGGTIPHHDEGEAIRDMSGLSLINKFMGKTPDQINELMSRVI